MSVTIGDKHTVNDWGLICVDVAISSPTPKTRTVSIRGLDGIIDVNDYLGVSYDNRVISMSFVHVDTMAAWHMLRAEIEEYLHGKVMDIVFDTDPDSVWRGRCTCESRKEDAVHSTFTIEASVHPYNAMAGANAAGNGEKSVAAGESAQFASRLKLQAETPIVEMRQERTPGETL